MRPTLPIPESEIISQHRFTQPRIRLWLPVVFGTGLLMCGLLVVPSPGPLGLLGLAVLLYVAISALVAVGEITVLDDGLIIDRLLLPQRFVPWSAVERVVVYSKTRHEIGMRLEVASIGVAGGLSPLNRLPGLAYGQGFRQAIMISPDALQDYETLLVSLEAHCPIIWQVPRR